MPWEDPRSNCGAHNEAHESTVDSCNALSQSTRRAVSSRVAVRTRSDDKGTNCSTRQKSERGACESMATRPRVHLEPTDSGTWR